MTKRINLGLQGGGAHGAFTWGVLDRLLQDDDIEIAAISGTSAGALNAAALKAGWVQGGRDGARANLDWLWSQVGSSGVTAALDWPGFWSDATPLLAKAMEMSPGYQMFDWAARMTSPYVYGPLLQNPLRRLVEQLVFTDVCANQGPELHICATNVRSGKVRVFTGDDISVDVILASACLPTLFQAIEFEDPKTGKTEAFWDGGYTGNPALFPLFARHLPDDILIVNINPLYRADLPRDSQAIANRINEISFNSSLLRELRAISFVKRLLAEGTIDAGAMKNVLVHMIADDALMTILNVATKTIPNAVVLSRLKTAGQAAAHRFLEAHKDQLNTESTVNLDEMFN